ncbi:AMP-binding protein, partial [Mycobacterium alsense]|uniref:AMP-binding protein n=1 Tax=Mycobacterium alsense TaxID=324058 RepID=UPI0013F4FA45
MSQQLADRIRAVLSLDPRAPAIEFQGRWMVWQEVSDIATGVQNGLLSADLGQASPVGLVLRNDPSMIAAMLGVLLTGGCVVTINPSQGDAG